jgi:plasmid stabilization system protein ParE
VSDYALHPEALDDIDDIWQYIANDSVDAADRAIETIFENIARLAASPQQGHRRPDLTSAPLAGDPAACLRFRRSAPPRTKQRSTGCWTAADSCLPLVSVSQAANHLPTREEGT